MFEIRSVNGVHLKRIIALNYPSQYATAIPQMARDLGISKRTLYAYIQEERRVPEHIERKIVDLWGEIPEAGWRIVEATYLRKEVKKPNSFEPRPTPVIELDVEADAGWTVVAQASARLIAERLHGHQLGEWVGNDELLGKDGHSLDLVAECQRCGMLVAIDAGLQEVNGFAWRAFCGSQNLWKGAR